MRNVAEALARFGAVPKAKAIAREMRAFRALQYSAFPWAEYPRGRKAGLRLGAAESPPSWNLNRIVSALVVSACLSDRCSGGPKWHAQLLAFAHCVRSAIAPTGASAAERARR